MKPLNKKRVTLEDAVEAFFADRDLAANTRDTYRPVYRMLLADLGAITPISTVEASNIKTVMRDRWGDAAPNTWNSRLGIIGTLFTYCRRQNWTDLDPAETIERRRPPEDNTKAISYDELDALWNKPDIDLREKLLWHMLYSTAARASEILALNIEDLDRARKRAAIVGKGGHRDIVIWDTTTARLIPRYLGDRTHGPLFVTKQKPTILPTDDDRCPDTGLSRLSYQQAWKDFRAHTDGWTLHQLRHSALTHLGEAGVSGPLLMAKSRHRNLNSLA